MIKEWVRCLKEGGTMEIRCPDLRARALLLSPNPNWQNVKNIYGSQDNIYGYHRCGFSYGLLKNLLIACGIVRIKRVIKREGYYGIPFVPHGLHVIGYKGASPK